MTQIIIGPDTTDKVAHFIYPEGLEVSEEMMNPHIGGWLRSKDTEV